MTERASSQAQVEAQSGQATTSGRSPRRARPGSAATRSPTAKGLLDWGAITAAEFERMKAKALAIPTPR